MPKRDDIKKVLLIGAGPTAVGQTGEFDYAGLEVCRLLKDEGIKIVVVDNNPNTMVTDYRFADSVYLEPLTVTNLERIISIEKPDSLIAGFGGQSALNLGYFLFKEGISDKFQIKLLGIEPEIIEKTENRFQFQQVLREMGLKIPAGGVVTSIGEGIEIGQQIGFPVVICSSFAPEGSGVLMAYNKEELEEFIETALNSSPIQQVLIEESLYGWTEIEYEIVRDSEGKVMIISALENIDPVGVHTGDSAVVIPAQSLPFDENRRIVEVCKQILQKIGATGVINLQFAVNPGNKDLVLLEVNPRFTRSSALVSKACGVQIPAVAIKIALGYKLDEIFGQSKTIAESYELQSDYVAVKLPCFNFEKFPTAEWMLGTSMKSVGEVIAFGGNFKEAFQKAIRSLNIGRYGLGADGFDPKEEVTLKEIKEKIINPNANRWFYIRYALKQGISLQEVADLSKLNYWFLKEISEIIALEKKLTTYALYNLTSDVFWQAKQWGFSDAQLAYLLRTTDEKIRGTRNEQGIKAGFIRIETSGLAIESKGYFFSTYHSKLEIKAENGDGILLPGSGPTRVGRGIEYDYSLVKASLAIIEIGRSSIIVNSNPSSISTDPANSSILYIEPLNKEELLNIIEYEQPVAAILQFSGQISKDLLAGLKSKLKLLGTNMEDYDRGSNWICLKEVIKKNGLLSPKNGEAVNINTALEIANKIGYPVIVRPSFIHSKPVEIIYDREELSKYIAGTGTLSVKSPLLFEEFIDDAVGLVVTGVSDGQDFVVAGVMEQIEEAAINPADSACSLPPYSVGTEILVKTKEISRLLAQLLNISGILNVKFAVKQDTIYLIDVNPFSCLFIPFLSKATGIDWTAIACKAILGTRIIKDQGLKETAIRYTAIKEAAFSFDRFPGVDALLGPEVRSTGTAMVLDQDFGLAFIKAQLMVGEKIPTAGTIFLNIRNEDKRFFFPIIRRFIDLGFKFIASEETATALLRNNIPCESVFQVGEGRPNIIDKIKNLEVQWIISTFSGRKTKPEEISIRSTAVQRDIPIITTVSGTKAAIIGMERYLTGKITVKSIEDYYRKE